MGEVFLAQDTLTRDVAIKVLALRLMVGPEFERRFFREARTVARFRHPNLVEVYDYSGDEALSANVRETRSTQGIRVGRRQRKRTCWDCEREWKRMVVPLEVQPTLILYTMAYTDG